MTLPETADYSLTESALSPFPAEPAQDPEIARQEKYRYERFLGTAVKYTNMSFDEFTDDPLTVIAPAARPLHTIPNPTMYFIALGIKRVVAAQFVNCVHC